MQAAGGDWRMNLYAERQHSFTHPGATARASPASRYHDPSRAAFLVGDARPVDEVL